MHSLIRLYQLPCSPFFILFIPHLFSCSSPIVSFLPSPIIENKKTENPGKNVYITKSCLMLSILPRYSYFDSSDLCIHLKAVLRRSKKSSLQNCGYSCGIDIPHADCQPRLVGVAKGLLPLKNCHGICIVTHCNCIENAGFFVFLCCCLGHFC